MKQIIVYALLFWMIGFFFEYVYLRFTPADRFFEMQSVEPVRDVFRLWETPYFKTFADYKYSWTVTRRDIQYCRENKEQEFSYYTLYETSTYIEEPRIVLWKERRYNIEWPETYMECYLYNITSLTLPYGIDKIQTYISWPYEYKDLSFNVDYVSTINE